MVSAHRHNGSLLHSSVSTHRNRNVSFSSLQCISFSIPGIIKEFRGLGIVLTIGEALLLTGVIANFFMATVMDPGVIPKGKV